MAIGTTQRRWQSPGGWIAALVVVALVIGVIVAIFAFLVDDDAAVPGRGVAVSTVLANPEVYYDEEDVTVSGEVNRILSPFAYTIGGEEFGDQELLVVGPPPAAVAERTEERPLFRRDIVQVAGELRPFEIEALEAEIDADLADEQLAEFVGQPVLLAESTVLAPRSPVVRGVPVSVADVLEDPARWQDENVIISGRVAQVIGPGFFVLEGEDGEGLAVLDGTGAVTERAVAEADVVQVMGPVVPFEQLVETELVATPPAELEGMTTVVAEVIRII
jgi:hypothetical protein